MLSHFFKIFTLLIIIFSIYPQRTYAHLPVRHIDEMEVSELKAKADSGDVKSMVDLAELVSISGDMHNYPMAIKYYELAISKGDTKSLTQLGDIYAYYSPIGDIEKAKSYYEQAISKGIIEAYIKLGNLYSKKEPEKAKQLYEKAGINGNAFGYYILSQLYKKNYPLSLEYLQKAYKLDDGYSTELCNMNNKFTQYLYYKSEAISGDFEQAIIFANYIAKEKNYEDGDIVFWGKDTELEQLKWAAEINDSYGAQALGEYFLGEFIIEASKAKDTNLEELPISPNNKNLIQSMFLFEKAASAGDYRALQNLPAIYHLLGKNDLIEDAIRNSAFTKNNTNKKLSNKSPEFDYYNDNIEKKLEITATNLNNLCDLYDGKKVTWYLNTPNGQKENYVILKLKKNLSRAQICRVQLSNLNKSIRPHKPLAFPPKIIELKASSPKEDHCEYMSPRLN